ncbi:MAG TPA: G1 family glutamic endopeptidase [Solirubrobacteraceae bacterium]|nr:G1 family glutamic endopeptidase [Solirubrobacteraceae bacterium]
MPSRLPRFVHPRLRALGALGVAALACLCAAPAALADTAVSGNWAGYAAHGSGVHFRTVTGRWQVPKGACTGGEPGYSSIWVGLGGYSVSSNALEQTGTELDCTRGGRAVYSAWYEIVPAPAHGIKIGVRGGDLMQATVTVKGHRVTVVLQDLTRHRGFRRTVSAAGLDTTSAEWIVEAPSACDGSGDCFTLPLADFGSATISSARAVNRRGLAGGITSPWWAATEITLAPHGTRFFADSFNDAGGKATPSLLAAGASSFSVTYEGSASGTGVTGQPGPTFSGHLVHPRR